MRNPGGRKREESKKERRIKAFDETMPYDEFGDGKRRWFRTQGGKVICMRRPGSNK